MKNILVVVDMQNDFVSGALGTVEAREIADSVAEKIESCRKDGGLIVFTKDTHDSGYMRSREGKYLPVAHCVKGTDGHELAPQILAAFREGDIVIEKPTFGSTELVSALAPYIQADTVIELCGVCTDICVVSNALILKAAYPETDIAVDSACCAGVTPQKHAAALTTMASCQITVK